MRVHYYISEVSRVEKLMAAKVKRRVSVLFKGVLTPEKSFSSISLVF